MQECWRGIGECKIVGKLHVRWSLSSAQGLEAELIRIIREVAAEFRRAGPALFPRQGFERTAAPCAQGVNREKAKLIERTKRSVKCRKFDCVAMWR
jgi:hypothetical protein